VISGGGPSHNARGPEARRSEEPDFFIFNFWTLIREITRLMAWIWIDEALGSEVAKFKSSKFLKFLNSESWSLNLQVQESESSESSQAQRHGSSKAQKSKAPEFKLLKVLRAVRL
jgi:hypothetical protein